MIPAISISTNTAISTHITVNSGPKASKFNPRDPLNQTLKSLFKAGKLDEAINLIQASPSHSRNPEAYSILLHACISTRSLQHGQKLYSQFLRDNELLKNANLRAKLITLFSICGQMNEARRIFEDALQCGQVAEPVWLAMLIGFSRNGCFREALLVYIDMLNNSEEPRNFALSVALKACAGLNNLPVGRGIHAQIVKSSETPDQVVNNALLSLYAEFGCFEGVLRAFDEMPERNIVSWNSLIAGFVKQDQLFQSMEAFRTMQRDRVGFSWVTLTTILPVCARLTALHSGKEIHAQIVKSRVTADVLVLNSLMDMYAKCGEVDYCSRVFDRMTRRDLTSWNTMLNGFVINGCMERAMKLFDTIVESSIKPDRVTFITLLSGSSHSGLTDYGKNLFQRMEMDFGVSPSTEHYACLVDILGRSGRLEEAIEVVENMPMKPSGSIWGSLLNSCRLHGSVPLGEHVAEKLFELEPDNPGNYVLLSNIYANAGMWEDVHKVRDKMQSRGIKKEAGCSWIQINDRIHTFVAGGGFEFRNSAEYKKISTQLMEAMEEVGYVPATGVVLHDVDEEIKATWVCGHSERLATIFALIHTADGLPIRITKNLRVCVDCHSWVKIVSKVTGRMIVLRDTNHFHHFKNGICSCKDYW